jgi:hypothetical protein
MSDDTPRLHATDLPGGASTPAAPSDALRATRDRIRDVILRRRRDQQTLDRVLDRKHGS